MSKSNSPLRRALRDASRNTDGSIAVVVALCLTALLGLAGAAIDYSRAMNARTTLQQAADAAALTAARDPNMTNTAVSTKALASVAANARNNLIKGTPTASVQRTGGSTPSVEVTVNANVDTTLMRLIGVSTMPVQGSAKAGISLLYSTVYAVIDMSSSMGIAADATERAKLEAATSTYTPGGCMFGCHQRDGWEPAGKTVYQMARDAGIKLREDVLEAAFGKFVDTFLDGADPAVASGRQTMGVYGFSDTATLLQAPSNSASVVKAAPPKFPDAQRINTLMSASLATIRTQLGAQGNGAPTNPRKTILLITDGVSWNRNSADTSNNGPITQATCDSFKSAGYDVAVLEVQYQDATGEYWFDVQVKPFYSSISPALQSCASPGLYFQATDSDATSLAQAFSTAAKALATQLALTR